jgi:hypothetical protein
LNEKYNNDWKFDREKNYLKGYDLRNKKYFGLTICSSYTGICKHIGTHKVVFERNRKRRIASDYNGLFVSITDCVNNMLWDSKRDEMLNKLNLTVYKSGQMSSVHESENKEHSLQHCAPYFVSNETKCVQASKKHPRCFFGKDSVERRSTKPGFETPLKNYLQKRDLTYDSKDEDTVVWGNKQNNETSVFTKIITKVSDEMNGRKLFNEIERHDNDVECLPFTNVTQQE